MANIIDITSKLEAARPFIQIGEKKYEVNDDKNVVIKMQAGMLESGEHQFEQMVTVLNQLLGEEAVADIEANNPGITTRVSTLKVLFISIFASVEGVPYETVEGRFRTED